MAVLISFAGLPGTGKSTIAKALSVATGAVFLRIDEIETSIRARDPAGDIGPEGYEIAAALAASNLALGHSAITDCVNPWALTRALFADAARRAGVRMLGVETYCSDPAVHRARVEGRTADVPGARLSTWQKVFDRDYTPWEAADVRIDTARLTVPEALAVIRAHL